MTLTVIPSAFNSKVIDVSGVSMKFDVDNYGRVTAISVLDNDVDVWIVTGSVAGHFVNVCNIQWLSLTGTFGDLGWRTSPTDSLQTESITYLPTTTGTVVTHGVDYSDAVDEVYEYTEHVHTIPSEVLTSNRGTNRVYAYYLYPERVSAYASNSIARRVHFLVSGTTTYAVADEVDLNGWYVAWLCKEDEDDDILYAAKATERLTIDFEAGTFSSEALSITAGYIHSEQRGKYVYFVYRTTTVIDGSNFEIGFSYERLDILTKTVTSVSLGSVAMLGTPGNYVVINQTTYKVRVDDGIIVLEAYIASGLEMGILYVTNSVGKSVQWTKVGADTIDYYHALGQRTPSGFVGNAGSSTHMLSFVDAWSSTRYYCGYAHLDEDTGLTVSLADVAYDDLDLPSRTNMSNNFIVCSSKYVTTPYFIDSQGVDVVIRSGLDGSVYTTLNPADYDCDALYPSWLYSSSDGISGNYSELGGNTRDDIDDSIYIFGELTADSSVRIFGIDEDGNEIKRLDIISALFRSHTYGFLSYASTSQGMIVDTRYTKNSSSHYSFYRGVRYFYPFNPDYVR